MIKLAIVHFPKELRLDVANMQKTRTFATTAPYASATDNLPKEYTLSFIDLILPPEKEQEFLQLVRRHQQTENGFHAANQLNVDQPATKLKDKTYFVGQGKALRGLGLMSSYIYNLSSNYADDSKIQNLTHRETIIMVLLCQGFLDKEIAARLHISTNTVKNHTKHIYNKLEAKNRIEALRIFLSVYLK